MARTEEQLQKLREADRLIKVEGHTWKNACNQVGIHTSTYGRWKTGDRRPGRHKPIRLDDVDTSDSWTFAHQAATHHHQQTNTCRKCQLLEEQLRVAMDFISKELS